MNAEHGAGPQPNDSDGARWTLTFMAGKFVPFAVLPVVVAALIVSITLPD